MDAKGLERLFTVPVSAAVATAQMYDAPLFPDEAAAVARAVAKRRREFTAGRACARAALSRLGVPAAAIARGPDRAPVWPADIVGSITHCDGFCAAVVARSGDALGVGLDAEDAAPLTPEMARQVCRLDEVARFAATPAPLGSSWPKLAFSAKEAFYKCCYPAERIALGFEDLSVWFAEGGAGASGSFRVIVEAPGKAAWSHDLRRQGLWKIEGGRVYTGVTMRAA